MSDRKYTYEDAPDAQGQVEFLRERLAIAEQILAGAKWETSMEGPHVPNKFKGWFEAYTPTSWWKLGDTSQPVRLLGGEAPSRKHGLTANDMKDAIDTQQEYVGYLREQFDKGLVEKSILDIAEGLLAYIKNYTPATAVNSQRDYRKALEEIRDFAKLNPGCGFTCGKMAEVALVTASLPESKTP